MERDIKLIQGDCLERMKEIPDASVDMILCDLPYGTTRLKWDICIPFDPLWEQYKRIVKDNGAILLFSTQPFTTDLINSNRKMFRYEIIWEKSMRTGFYNAKKCLYAFMKIYWCFINICLHIILKNINYRRNIYKII